jgi:thioredoxin reductase (NADPH)
VERFVGEGSRLRAIVVRDETRGRTEELALPAAFVFVGQEPNTGYLEGSPVRRDDRGFVVTGHALVHAEGGWEVLAGREPAPLETSVPGVFAAGDVRAGSTKQVASAAGEGAAAALMIRAFLQEGSVAPASEVAERSAAPVGAEKGAGTVRKGGSG